MSQSLAEACNLAPLCPVPGRIAASHWAGHLPFAFWLADILRPRIFVELGSYTGLSFCAFCQGMLQSGRVCEAYAVDLWQGDAHMGAYGEDVYQDLQEHVSARYGHFASLLRMSFNAARAQFAPGSIDLLHLDGCHQGDAILHDFYSWLPLLSSRGIVLIHDVCTRLPGYGGVGAWEEIKSKFATFTFHHGYGLGLVVTGIDAPSLLKDFCSLSREEGEKVQRQFQEQGQIYECLLRQQEKHRHDLAVANAALEDQRQQMAQLQDIVVGERKSHAAECESLKEKLLQAELRANAYAGSLSWKITAPLRKLARCLGKSA